MKRPQRQGRRQHEEAQILIGRKASPDTPTPSVLKAPVSPAGAFHLRHLMRRIRKFRVSGSRCATGRWSYDSISEKSSKERMGNCSCPIRGYPDRALS